MRLQRDSVEFYSNLIGLTVVTVTFWPFICLGGATQMSDPMGSATTQSSNGIEKWTPIALAAANGDTAQLKKLLESGASLSDESFPNRMNLLAVAASGGHADTVSFLLRLGLNPNIPDRTGETALSYAILEQSLPTIKILLESNANSNAPNIQGDTPLHMAALFDDIEIIDMLITHGADPRIKDLFGKSPADFATGRGLSKIADHLAACATQKNNDAVPSTNR